MIVYLINISAELQKDENMYGTVKGFVIFVTKYALINQIRLLKANISVSKPFKFHMIIIALFLYVQTIYKNSIVRIYYNIRSIQNFKIALNFYDFFFSQLMCTNLISISIIYLKGL